MFEYQKNQKYFAQVTGSLEKYAAEELTSLGATVLSEESRGVRFTCDTATLYRINYCNRLIQRVLAPLISMQCHSEKYLYQQASANIDWTALLSLDQCFSIITNVAGSKIDNSLYAGQVLKDAICDQFKEKYKKRPNFKPKDGDIVLNLYIKDNWATIAFDIAGKSMHKRGYRTEGHTAPLQETLGAAIIKILGDTEKKPVYDIMCGSGTIIAEALMSYSAIPAGYLRDNLHIKSLPDFDEKLWKNIVSAANDKMIPLPKGILFGSDISSDAIEVTRKNLSNLPFSENISLTVSPFQKLPLVENRIIVCNPPYGIRMGKTEDIVLLYNDLGDFLKQKCPHSVAYVLSGKPELLPEIRLRIHSKKTIKNGDIEAKLAKIILR
ncbi:MAG: THUMP domain-containing protein [Candidatus Cloacimonetes bacterium]|nr:THUMP domain-containing protein [Candidatus Cloacimonadota bacterium]